MTYKDILNTLVDHTADTYKRYLESKIATLDSTDGFFHDQTEQYRAEYDKLEKKLVALLAIVKNDDAIHAEVPDNFLADFIK
ncbi:hypothetical protein [Pedobacter sp. L105]|uniref:hypothetical protein n=1 Tax=Pedobacter sp. L105 TaxID=1641871 RepID=UPI00131C06A1|nr:hypothetical protein [Pedobacter sp. L105]